MCPFTELLGLDWLMLLQLPKHIYGIRSATDRKRAYGYELKQKIEDVVTPIGLFHSKLQSPVAVLTDIKFFLNHFPNAVLLTSTIDFNIKIEYPCCSGFMEQRYVHVLNAGKRSRQVCKKNLHLWVVFFLQNHVPAKH